MIADIKDRDKIFRLLEFAGIVKSVADEMTANCQTFVDKGRANIEIRLSISMPEDRYDGCCNLMQENITRRLETVFFR